MNLVFVCKNEIVNKFKAAHKNNRVYIVLLHYMPRPWQNRIIYTEKENVNIQAHTHTKYTQ